MPRAAIYARYSTDEQRDTSLEDQIRRCREEAAKRGFDVPDSLVFSDAAISGTSAALDKRAGYRALTEAWDSRNFEALIVDEVSRLARDPLELARLQQRVERTNVRLISADGIDSATPNWQLPFGLAGVIGAHFLRETQFRVVRGMKGQLERGFQIADAPIGYKGVREYDSSGNPVGTKWEVHDETAQVVREMFQMRRDGLSLSAIASELNRRGLRTPRKAKNGEAAYWRSASVQRVFSNTIYRGVFVWNGSTTKRYAAEKAGQTVETVEYERPELRIVDDETWRICAVQPRGKRFRGGRKHMFSGLLACGHCGNRLSHSAFSNRSSLHCHGCSHAVRVGAQASWVGYVGTAGVRAALLLVVRELFDDTCVQEFRKRLRRRLEGDRSGELEAAKERARRARSAYERLLRLTRDMPGDDETLEREVRAAGLEAREADRKVKLLEAGLEQIDRAGIERQLEVNPREMLEKLFDAEAPIGRVQAVLQRLFPRIALVTKRDRYTSVLEICLAPGVAFAHASETRTLEEETVTVRVEVFAGPKRPAKWLAQFVAPQQRVAA